MLSFLVRGSAKRGEKKRRPVSVNDDVVLFAAVKVAAAPEALLTLLVSRPLRGSILGNS